MVVLLGQFARTQMRSFTSQQNKLTRRHNPTRIHDENNANCNLRNILTKYHNQAVLRRMQADHKVVMALAKLCPIDTSESALSLAHEYAIMAPPS